MHQIDMFLSVGEIMAEWLFHLPHIPPANATLVTRSLSRQLGGPALNLSWYLSELGRSSSLVSAISRWDLHLLSETYSRSLIDTSRLIATDYDTDTLFSIVLKEAHHSVYSMANLSSNFEDKLVEQCLNSKRLALNGGRHPEVRSAYIRLCETFDGELLAFNPSYAIYEYSARELQALLQKSQVTIFNQQEARFAEELVGWREQTPKEKTETTFIITMGREGAQVLQGQHSLHLPSCAREEGLAIGAGDAFFAGFLHEKLRGGSLSSCAEYASALAALVVEASVVRLNVNDECVLRRKDTVFSAHGHNEQ